MCSRHKCPLVLQVAEPIDVFRQSTHHSSSDAYQRVKGAMRRFLFCSRVLRIGEVKSVTSASHKYAKKKNRTETMILNSDIFSENIT